MLGATTFQPLYASQAASSLLSQFGLAAHQAQTQARTEMMAEIDDNRERRREYMERNRQHAESRETAEGHLIMRW